MSEDWIARLFARLHVRYGRDWAQQWAGLDPAAVAADWRHTLQRQFDANPDAIRHALDHLPDRVPTAQVFARLCMNAPTKTLALPMAGDRPDPAMTALVAERIAAAQAKRPAHAAADCADRLRARLAAGERLTPAQRDMLVACERARPVAPDVSAGPADVALTGSVTPAALLLAQRQAAAGQLVTDARLAQMSARVASLSAAHLVGAAP